MKRLFSFVKITEHARFQGGSIARYDNLHLQSFNGGVQVMMIIMSHALHVMGL